MRRALLVLAVLIVFGFAWSVRYRYDVVSRSGEGILVRTNIYTGSSQVLLISVQSGGWRSLITLTPKQREDSDAAAAKKAHNDKCLGEFPATGEGYPGNPDGCNTDLKDKIDLSAGLVKKH